MTKTTEKRSAIAAKSNGEPKHARLRQDLLQRISAGGFKPGDEFVTEHELIRQYGVSSTTARRCLNDLARAGFLVRRRGSGTYISEMALIWTKHAFGVVCSSVAAALNTPSFNHILTGLERNLRELDWRISLVTSQGFESAHNPGLALAELARQHAYKGLFIISHLPEPWIRDVYDSALPLVSINVEFPSIPMACIMTDAARHTRQASDYLFSLGHRHIALFLGQPPEIAAGIPTGAKISEQELQKIREEHGPTVRLTSAVYNYGDSAGLEKILEPLFTTGIADRPTAVIVTEYSAARVVEYKARSAGWILPGDLSIMTFEAGSPHTSFTAIEPHLENLCWRAVRIMEGLVTSHPPARRREMVGCDLVVRKSTAPPTQNGGNKTRGRI